MWDTWKKWAHAQPLYHFPIWAEDEKNMARILILSAGRLGTICVLSRFFRENVAQNRAKNLPDLGAKQPYFLTNKGKVTHE